MKRGFLLFMASSSHEHAGEAMGNSLVDSHRPASYNEARSFRGCSAAGAHLHGMQGARGSNPLTSTRKYRPVRKERPFSFSFSRMNESEEFACGSPWT